MENDPSKTAAYLAGAIDKLVKNQGRETVKRNAEADPRARWARIPDGTACDFCVMLGSRGFVYHSEESAGGDDPYHPMCNCQIAVSFDPLIEKYQVGMTTVTRGYADDAMLVVPALDGSDELRDVDIDEMFEQYKAVGKSYNKRSVYKDYALMPDFMADPIAYLESAATEEELRRRAGEVLAAYKEHFSAKQLDKYLPSARAAAHKRLGELSSHAISELRIKPSVLYGNAEEQYWQRALKNEEARAVAENAPEAFEEWIRAASRIGSYKTSQSLRQHVPGTKEFDATGDKSYYYVDESLDKEKRVAAVRDVINDAAGTGYPGVTSDGHWDGYEHVRYGRILGVDGWSKTETASMKIHYGSDKIHAVLKYDGSSSENGYQGKRDIIR